MTHLRPLLAACLAAPLLLGLVPSGPTAHARPGGSGTAGELGPLYFGFWSSTNGDNESGQALFDVTGTDGKDFTGTMQMSGPPLGSSAGSLGLLDIDVAGSISPKRKLAMEGDVGEGVKFIYKGALTDQGVMINGTYTLKQGRQVLKKGQLVLVVV
jgi:hypothetical protein